MADDTAAGAGRLLGTNQLQGVLDKLGAGVSGLTGAANRLDSVISKMAAQPTGFGGGNGQTSQRTPAVASFGPTSNAGGTVVPAPVSMPSGTGWPGSGTGSGGTGPPGATPAPPAANAGGPNISAPQSMGGAGNGGGSGGPISRMMPASMGTAASGAFRGLMSWGGGQLNTMAAMSAYIQQGGLAAPNGMSAQTASAMLRQQAFGAPGAPNTIANSPMDAMQAAAQLSYASGSFNASNPLGRAMGAATNAFGYTNPGMGALGSAQLATQFYSPQTSMMMMMSGMPGPRQYGGGQIGMNQWISQAMQRWYGQRAVPMSQLNASLSSNGRINAMLGAYGFSGQNLIGMENQIRGYNQLAQHNFTPSKITQVFDAAAQGKSWARDILQNQGHMSVSQVQMLKDRTAQQAQTSSNEYTGFNRGLQDSVGLLTSFNRILTTITRGPLGTLLGSAGGIGAGAGLANLKSIPILGNFLGTATSALGTISRLGGGALPAGGGASSTSSQTAPKTSGMATSSVSGAAKAAVGWADQEIGKPYVWGGENPSVGFDCSGLVQWSYGKAGVNLPRTSQAQWAYLDRAGKTVGLNQVQEGDLVFNSGVGDGGTFSSPGHVAMMVNNRTIIEAATTGVPIRTRAYNPSEWQHAARPTGPKTSGTGPGSSSSSSASGPASASSASASLGSFSGAPASTSEADNIAAALSGGSGAGAFMGFPSTLGGTTTSTNGTSTGGMGAPAAPGNVSGNAALMKKMAAAKGWTGSLWNDLYNLEMREAGFRLNAKNPSSGAYGMAQFINGPSEYYQYGGNPNTAAGQITGMFNYVDQRYHGPAAAWQHEQQYSWYGQGTRNARRGPAVVGDRGPELLWLNGGEGITPANQTKSMLSGTRTAGQRGQVAIVLNFAEKSIQVHGGNSGSDVSSAAREISHNIGKYLEQENVIKQISMGVG